MGGEVGGYGRAFWKKRRKSKGYAPLQGERHLKDSLGGTLIDTKNYRLEVRHSNQADTGNERGYGFNAEVGDDVYGEDPTVNRLEALAAEMVGKGSGCILYPQAPWETKYQLCPGRKGETRLFWSLRLTFIRDASGRSAVLSQVQVRPITGKYRAMDPCDVKSAVRGGKTFISPELP